MVGVKEMELGNENYKRFIQKSPAELASAIANLIEMGAIKLATAHAIRIDSTKMDAVLPSLSGYFVQEDSLGILQKNILNYFIQEEQEEEPKAIEEKKTNVTVLPAKKEENTTKKETSSADLTLADLLKLKGVK